LRLAKGAALSPCCSGTNPTSPCYSGTGYLSYSAIMPPELRPDGTNPKAASQGANSLNGVRKPLSRCPRALSCATLCLQAATQPAGQPQAKLDQFYVLRSCKDLADVDSQSVYDAIIELTL